MFQIFLAWLRGQGKAIYVHEYVWIFMFSSYHRRWNSQNTYQDSVFSADADVWMIIQYIREENDFTKIWPVWITS